MSLSKVKLTQRNCENAVLWILLDPDRCRDAFWENLESLGFEDCLSGFLVGSSLQTTSGYGPFVKKLRSKTSLPIVLFPGSGFQISSEADGILLLSLISGRNPDYLIGQHVTYASALRDSGLALLPTGYLLIDGGKSTTAHYITQTIPIPHDKPDIAAITALAGAQLGLRLIYLDAGSGAKRPVSTAMVAAVRQAVDLPIVVGGGIASADQIMALRKAGADWVVIGNAIEQNPEHLTDILQGIRSAGLDSLVEFG